MKKVSLLMLVAIFLFAGNVNAQEPEVLISDDFSAYTVGNNIATEGMAAGNNWWTTWSSAPGSSEDGVVAEYNGNKCGYLTYGVDQVLLLGGEQSGVYDLEFDILIPDGKNGYFNILHDFNGSGSTWALESYLHMDGTNQTPGTGYVIAGGVEATVTCVFDEWMHFRLHVDTDADAAQYFYTLPGGEETMLCEWQWSMNSQGTSVVGRKLDAMDFFPPQNAATSEYYLDNFSFTRIGGESFPELVFDTEAIDEEIPADDMSSLTINIDNEGTSIGDWTAWVDYGEGEGGSAQNVINYDQEPGGTTSLVGLNLSEPMLIECAAMYPATAYGNSVMGTYITKIQYFLGESSEGGNGLEPNTPMTFRIYSQGLYGQPGEVLAEKTIQASQIINDWNIVTLDEPVALTGYNVWASVEFTQAVDGYPMNFDGAVLVPYGDMYRTQGGGAFQACSEVFTQTYGNFHIRITCEGSPVVGGWATLSKPDGTIAVGGSDEVTVNFSSIGLEAEQTYEAEIIFTTNDPENGTKLIPVTLSVKGENVNEILSDTYNVYPNPTTGAVMVEGENIDYIAVYNSVGQLLNVVKNETNVVDMSQYENGVYFFNIVDNAGQESLQRVVVAK
ncbi:MAG: T9SS type A sorting domain-containing protein [Bacteroidales bacterium]|nr:T9SS type A sorting domain-containing protein [Bacteroidales bacterium]